MKKTILTIALAALFVACTPVEYDHISTITGMVVDDDDNAPIAYAEISLIPSSKNTESDDNGYFQFVRVEAQKYTIQVQKTGYRTYRKDIIPVAGETENVIIHLKKQQ